MSSAKATSLTGESLEHISGKADIPEFLKSYGSNFSTTRAGRCWASTEVSRLLAKTAPKESTMLELLACNEETLITETTIDGEVMKESIIGEVGGGRRRSTRSTTKAIEASAGDQ